MHEGLQVVDSGPSQEQLDAFHTGETTLFDIYSDREVTIQGVTGTIGALINLCPKPIDEMTKEGINNWTADILTESGYELPQEIKEAVAPIDTKKNRKF